MHPEESQMPEGDGELDHPDSMAEDAEDDESATLRPLFPDGVADEDKAAEYRTIASAGGLA